MTGNLKNKLDHIYAGRAALPNALKYHFSKLLGSKPGNCIQVPMIGLNSTIHVNPLHIKRKYVRRKNTVRYKYLFNDENWQERIEDIDFDSNAKFLTIQELVAGVPAKQTSEYKQYAAHLEPGQKHQGKSRQEYPQYLENMRKMYRKIIADGCFDPAIALLDPIKIGITSDEQIVKLTNGNHRLAIAHFAKLESIPVVVKSIHSDILKKFDGSNVTISALNQYLKSIETKFSAPPDR